MTKAAKRFFALTPWERVVFSVYGTSQHINDRVVIRKLVRLGFIPMPMWGV